MCGSDGWRCRLRETNDGGRVSASSYADVNGWRTSCVQQWCVLEKNCKQDAAVLLDELIVFRGLLQIKTTTPSYDVAADLAELGAQQATSLAHREWLRRRLIMPGCIVL